MEFQNKKELQDLLKYERKLNGKGLGNPIVDFVFQRPAYLICCYLRHLRCLEFYRGKGLFVKVKWLYHYYCKTKLSYKLGYQIPPGTCGRGLVIYHYGGGIIINGSASLGDNCKLYPGVIIGSTPEGVPAIGNNVWIGGGTKIVGKVIVGNNVIIAPNSVVQKDIPDNSIVGGIPAKVLKNIDNKNYNKYSDYLLPF